MKIIEQMRRVQAATVGAALAALPPRTETPITAESIRQALETPTCPQTIH